MVRMLFKQTIGNVLLNVTYLSGMKLLFDQFSVITSKVTVHFNENLSHFVPWFISWSFVNLLYHTKRISRGSWRIVPRDEGTKLQRVQTQSKPPYVSMWILSHNVKMLFQPEKRDIRSSFLSPFTHQESVLEEVRNPTILTFWSLKLRSIQTSADSVHRHYYSHLLRVIHLFRTRSCAR